MSNDIAGADLIHSFRMGVMPAFGVGPWRMGSPCGDFVMARERMLPQTGRM